MMLVLFALGTRLWQQIRRVRKRVRVTRKWRLSFSSPFPKILRSFASSLLSFQRWSLHPLPPPPPPSQTSYTDILAVVHNTGCNLGIGGVSSINHFYGHDDIILGAWKGEFGSDCDKHYEGTSGQNQVCSAFDPPSSPTTLLAFLVVSNKCC